jgi:hypothetical protein
LAAKHSGNYQIRANNCFTFNKINHGYVQMRWIHVWFRRQWPSGRQK